ncbi:hypothetical protein K456DRAFT_228356 [Colletotrichum gloeosporioides 23]|nr:hypothetical protein K456DRAFT_228356 [Colletotrichum gloeosporioides 23]
MNLMSEPRSLRADTSRRVATFSTPVSSSLVPEPPPAPIVDCQISLHPMRPCWLLPIDTHTHMHTRQLCTCSDRGWHFIYPLAFRCLSSATLAAPAPLSTSTHTTPPPKIPTTVPGSSSTLHPLKILFILFGTTAFCPLAAGFLGTAR